jgi:hypothetical protein
LDFLVFIVQAMSPEGDVALFCLSNVSRRGGVPSNVSLFGDVAGGVAIAFVPKVFDAIGAKNQ